MKTEHTTETIYKGHIFKGIDKIVSTDELSRNIGIAPIIQGSIVATDAHHLVKIDLYFFGLDADSIAYLEGKCIDKNTLAKLGQIKTNESWFINEQGFNMLKGSTGRVGVIYPLTKTEEEGKYPDFEAVIPTKKQSIESISFSPKLLAQVDYVFETYKHNTLMEGVLKMEFYGQARAILLRNADDNFLGLVMPIKISS